MFDLFQYTNSICRKRKDLAVRILLPKIKNKLLRFNSINKNYSDNLLLHCKLVHFSSVSELNYVGYVLQYLFHKIKCIYYQTTVIIVVGVYTLKIILVFTTTKYFIKCYALEEIRENNLMFGAL